MWPVSTEQPDSCLPRLWYLVSITMFSYTMQRSSHSRSMKRKGTVAMLRYMDSENLIGSKSDDRS